MATGYTESREQRHKEREREKVRVREREREREQHSSSSTGVRLNDTPMRRWRLLLTSVYIEEEVLCVLA